MLNELKTTASYTRTENGALTYSTTGSECLDLFATVGGLRSASAEEIACRFLRAYAEDADLAMKILFYTRDIREGLGERRIFREIVKWLCTEHANSVIRNIPLFAEYGRFDDLLVLMDTPCETEAIHYMKRQFEADLSALKNGGSVSLLAKWLPSVNASSRETVRLGKRLAKAFGMTEREYRKSLSELRRHIDILENRLREADYTFDYEKQCGKAMLKYRKAFLRRDEMRYQEYLDGVRSGHRAMHTSTLMPYEIIRPLTQRTSWNRYGLISDEEAAALDVTWNAQEDFGGDENVLVVIDGSASMYTRSNLSPASVAQSLGLYFAERNRGEFRNHFITFSCRPQLVEVKGATLCEKIRYIQTFDEVANTDIQAVFDLILRTAVQNQLPQEEMPSRIVIVSDMEFDYCADGGELTNFELAKRKYSEAGYALPQVVFWNVASRKQQIPVRQNEQGVILVSGCTARLFAQIAFSSSDSYQYMLDIIGSARYGPVAA